MTLTLVILIFLATVILHELCHGLAAYYLGDPTAKNEGRLTLNPIKHIDPFWTVLFPGLLFVATAGQFAIGMAKPVPVDFSRLRSPRRDMMLVAFAGPLANFVLAIVFNYIWKMTGNGLFLLAIYFNLGLAFFNLIPIPPLDGSRIVGGLLPMSWGRIYFKLERYGFLIVVGLYLSGILLNIILPAMNVSCSILGVPQLRM